MNIQDTQLYQQIINEKNIYSAIYSLESYIFEEGLLSENDIKTYHSLYDKHNSDIIDPIIRQCSERLRILLTKDELFNVNVFFKLKKYNHEEKSFSYRPIHTASLIDQICMVCMLQVLMFEDKEDYGVRKLSNLCKLLPNNFYGNIPSTNVEELFCNWKNKYKEYSEKTIEKYNEYKETHKYTHEIILDIKNFFPSINPLYVFNLINNTLGNQYRNDEKKVLHRLLTKLLFFNISVDNIKNWEIQYYNNNLSKDTLYMNCGIAQGLPQSYFFGNLTMVHISKCINQIFNGDSYYYVDDSVTFSHLKDGTTFNKSIILLNELLKQEINCNKNIIDSTTLSEEQKEFQLSLNYKIEVHDENGKSTCEEIQKSHSNLGNLQNIARQVSIAAVLSDNLDDDDDARSILKLEKLIEVIDNELKKDKSIEAESYYSDNDIKRLKRYKRYFLFRLRRAQLNEEGNIIEKFEKFIKERVPQSPNELIDFFNKFDEEIFHAECNLYMNKLEKDKQLKLQEKVSIFEKIALKQTKPIIEFDNYLYLTKNMEVGPSIASYKEEKSPYISLKKKFRHLDLMYTKPENKYEQLRNIFKESDYTQWLPFKKTYHPSAEFICKSSNNYRRRILNAYISTLFNFEINDIPTVTKIKPSRNVNFCELRLITFLRNRNFKLDDFVTFSLSVINETPILRDLKIDNNIIEVLDIFIQKVRNPLQVDALIQTHRFVNALWINGSKFLNAYTLHNEDHAITLIRNCVRIIKVIDYLNLKTFDYFILFLACYLHDISMVEHPNLDSFSSNQINSDCIATKYLIEYNKIKDQTNITTNLKHLLLDIFNSVYSYFETKIRTEHAKTSAQFIIKHEKDFFKYLEKSVIQLVSTISASHGYDTNEVYGRKSKAKQALYSEKYLMILIRLADLMDMSKDRVNYYLLRQNIKNLSNISQFHWISHLVTDSVTIDAIYNTNDKRLNEQPITETIFFRIKLNVNYKNHHDCCGKGCDKWIADFTNNDRITLSIKQPNISQTCSQNCNITCIWMKEKHFYLYNELVALENYLSMVNNSLFQTKFKVEIKYGDSLTLDQDFYDSITEYISRNI